VERDERVQILSWLSMSLSAEVYLQGAQPSNAAGNYCFHCFPERLLFSFRLLRQSLTRSHSNPPASASQVLYAQLLNVVSVSACACVHVQVCV